MRLPRLALALLPLGSVFALGLGCSDPVPPTPKAAWTATFVDPGVACIVGGHTATVGSVSADANASVAVDGVDGASIDCKVSGSSSFSVEGSAIQGAKGLTISIPSISTAAKQASPVHGIVAFTSPNTVKTYSSPSDTPCNFYFESKETVGTGKIWVTFECPKVSAEGSDCAIQIGHALFENCAE